MYLLICASSVRGWGEDKIVTGVQRELDWLLDDAVAAERSAPGQPWVETTWRALELWLRAGHSSRHQHGWAGQLLLRVPAEELQVRDQRGTLSRQRSWCLASRSSDRPFGLLPAQSPIADQHVCGIPEAYSKRIVATQLSAICRLAPLLCCAGLRHAMYWSKIGAATSSLQDLWRRRIQDRVPLQYLTHSAHWRDVVLAVGPGTLIPRPETERMVDMAAAAVECNPDLRQDAHWLDLGTGSGALAIGLALVLPGSAQVRTPHVGMPTNALASAHSISTHQSIKAAQAQIDLGKLLTSTCASWRSCESM